MPVERRDILCYGVVRPCIRLWSFQFSGLFFAIFAAIGLKLGVLLCSQELLFQSVIDSFLQELCPWNLAEFQIFLVFRTFFCHLCRYKIKTWFIAL
jgi:hypothetical protein